MGEFNYHSTTITLKKYFSKESKKKIEERTSRNLKKDEVGNCLRIHTFSGHQRQGCILVLCKLCCNAWLTRPSLHKSQMQFPKSPLPDVRQSRMAKGGWML